MKIAITSGEPAGIGINLCLMAAEQLNTLPTGIELVIIGNYELFKQRAALLQLDVSLPTYQPQKKQAISLLSLPLGADVTAGELNAGNAQYVLDTLDTAINGINSGEFAAVVTAPIQKNIINEAGIPFTGHTEYFADYYQVQPVMMLASEQPNNPLLPHLRVALATTHLPLSEVASQITVDSLTQTIQTTYSSLQQKFGISSPSIGVCGLNPHAGEAGCLGKEEIETINPVIQTLRDQGLRLSDALPADTIFAPNIARQYDAIISMYHDQGLPVLKHYGFGNAVNITLGLPIIRTSVDHGTALDKASSRDIDSGSLLAAINMAISMAQKAAKQSRNSLGT